MNPNFDQCDSGMPCMQTTTGCAPGSCVRRRPHPFSTIEGAPSDGNCVVCHKAREWHTASPFVVVIPVA